MQVLLAKHKADGSFYAVKVLQKKVILKKKEVKKQCGFVLHRTRSRSTKHTRAHKVLMLLNVNIFLRTQDDIKKWGWISLFSKETLEMKVEKVSASASVASKQVFPHSNTDFNLIFFLCTENNFYDSPKMNGATCWIQHLFHIIGWTASLKQSFPSTQACKRSPSLQPCLLHVLVSSHFPSFTVSLCSYTSSSTSSLHISSSVLLTINQPLISWAQTTWDEFYYQAFKGWNPFNKHCTCIKKGGSKPNDAYRPFYCCSYLLVASCSNLSWFLSPVTSKKTSWRRGMCSWRASNIPSWFGSITLFRLQRSFTLSLTMSTEERYEHEHQEMRWAETSPLHVVQALQCLSAVSSFPSSVAVLPSAKRAMLYWAESEVLHGRGRERHRLSSLSQHCLQVSQTTRCQHVPMYKNERLRRHDFSAACFLLQRFETREYSFGLSGRSADSDSSLFLATTVRSVVILL